MKDKDYDFAGWVTKNDLLCSDGVVIKHDAFKDNDGVKVPLVWDHDHNSPNNVLGHVILHNMDKGVYGYGYFNGTEEAKGAKASIEHGDISAMSIAANQIKREGQNVVHGRIFEVSLVLAGANPGALITDVISHSDDSTESAIIYTGNLIHASDDVVQQADNGGSPQMNDEENKQSTDPKQSDDSEKTIGEIINEMTPEQQDAVNAFNWLYC
jgi:Phage head maturation protease